MRSKPRHLKQRLNLWSLLEVLNQARLHELLCFFRNMAQKCPVRLLSDNLEANVFLRRSGKRIFPRKQYEREDACGPNIDPVVIFLLIAELWSHATWTAQGQSLFLAVRIVLGREAEVSQLDHNLTVIVLLTEQVLRL